MHLCQQGHHDSVKQQTNQGNGKKFNQCATMRQITVKCIAIIQNIINQGTANRSDSGSKQHSRTCSNQAPQYHIVNTGPNSAYCSKPQEFKNQLGLYRINMAIRCHDRPYIKRSAPNCHCLQSRRTKVAHFFPCAAIYRAEYITINTRKQVFPRYRH